MKSRWLRPWRRLALLAETTIALSIASLAIAMLPFRTVVRLMGKRAEGRRAPEPDVTARLRSAVLRVAPRLPWRVVCFQKGLAMHWMLRRRGFPSRLHYGLGLIDADLKGHVWVTLGDHIVIGEETEHSHTCVAAFPAE